MKNLFSNLRFLLSKTQYSSDITSKSRRQPSTLNITTWDFNKIEGGPFEDKNSKSRTMPKN